MISIYQLIINGIATYDDLSLILIPEVSMEPPAPKSYTVDVPGSDGLIDLSDFAGAPVFSPRTQKFSFYIKDSSPEKFEATKTQVSRLFHGKRMDYKLTWDAGWTYTGRWAVTSYVTARRGGTIVLSVTADPYKRLDGSPLSWLINAAGGVELTLPVGRKRVCPTIEVNRPALVTHEGRSWTLQPGAYRIRDLWLSEGKNRIIINTYPDYSLVSWLDVAGPEQAVRWRDISQKRLSELAAGGTPPQDSSIWLEVAGPNHDVRWRDIADKRWIELSHGAEMGDLYAAYITYDYLDL